MPTVRKIYFQIEEIQKILAGTKTQARRHIKQAILRVYRQGTTSSFHDLKNLLLNDGYAEDYKINSTYLDVAEYYPSKDIEQPGMVWCPYGKAGSILRIKEQYKFIKLHGFENTLEVMYRDHTLYNHAIPADEDLDHIAYKIQRGRWHLGLHMKPWFGRILLKVTDVTYQRLHDISDEELQEEGFDDPSTFKAHWDTAHQRRAASQWNQNPYIWVVHFKVYKTKKPIDKD